MIKSVTITNFKGNSLVIPLNEDYVENGMIITDIQGIGAGEADIQTTELATVDGSEYGSSRRRERNIVIKMLFSEIGGVSHRADLYNIENTRMRTYEFFPVKQKLRFLIETDRRLAYIDGYVESNDPDIFSDAESTQISIICPFPYFTDARNGGEKATRFFGVEPLFHFPFQNEGLDKKTIVFGLIRSISVENLWYEGDAEVGVRVHIVPIGETSDIRIANLTQGTAMTLHVDRIETLTGKAFGPGDELILNTVRGEKYLHLLRDGETHNVINALDKDAQWFTISYGDNMFSVESDKISNIQVTIWSKILYEGV